MPINAMIAQGSPDRGASALAITRQNRQLGIENRNRNSLLEMQGQRLNMDQERHGMYQQAFDQGQQDRAAQMQAGQANEQIGRLALGARSGDRNSAMALLEQLGLPQELADDPDAAELWDALAEKHGGYEFGTSGAMPSAVQEYEYFNRLDPDAQRRFLEVKRNPTPPPNQTVIQLPQGQAAFNPRTGETNLLSTRGDQREADAGDEAAKVVARTTAEWAQKKGQELPKLRATTNEMVTLLGQLESHPGFEWVYGAKSLAPVVPGTPQADAVALWDQVSGKAFLTAFETLKGGGPITDREGEKATAAMTRLANRKQSPAAARRALQELIQISEDVLARAEESVGQQAQSAPANVQRKRFNPETGKIE
jgi:hypothetical protein